MKKINLHFTPKIKIIDGKNNEIEVPHIIDYTVSQYVAEQPHWLAGSASRQGQRALFGQGQVRGQEEVCVI